MPRKIAQIIPRLALICALSSCIVLPVVDDTPADASCKTYTRSMSLQAVQLNPNCQDQYCLAAALTVSAGSILISESVVLTGNTVHWLEYQGTCSNGYLNTARRRFLKSIGKDHTEPGATNMRRSLPAPGNGGIV